MTTTYEPPLGQASMPEFTPSSALSTYGGAANITYRPPQSLPATGVSATTWPGGPILATPIKTSGNFLPPAPLPGVAGSGAFGFPI